MIDFDIAGQYHRLLPILMLGTQHYSSIDYSNFSAAQTFTKSTISKALPQKQIALVLSQTVKPHNHPTAPKQIISKPFETTREMFRGKTTITTRVSGTMLKEATGETITIDKKILFHPVHNLRIRVSALSVDVLDMWQKVARIHPSKIGRLRTSNSSCGKDQRPLISLR
ncbi:hypothetical protein ACMFMF_005268 [Clarireedia jacksonii]